MRAFTNTPVTKPMLITSLERHAAADNFIKGTYWESGKGCAVGCTLSDFTDKRRTHAEFERLFGIPQIIARLEDRLFERLPLELSMTWPLRFANAVNVGSDLSGVWNKYAHWLMLDAEFGVINKAKTDRSRAAIQGVGDGYAALIADPNAEIDWAALRRAANAAYAAADAAAAAAAAAAAYAAANAANAAADAADAAAAAAAANAAYAAYAAAARKNHIIAQSEKLLALIAECEAA